MKTLRLTLVALTAGLVTLIAPTAAQAVDYTAPVVNVTGGSGADGVVAPGEEFTINGDFGGTECNPWTAAFEGQGADGSGTTFSVTFTAPEEEGTYFINMTCTYEDAAETSSSAAKTVFFQAEAQLAPIRIVVGDGAGAGTGDATDQSGLLPDTGGSNLMLLVAGGALVLAGAGLVAARRRKA